MSRSNVSGQTISSSRSARLAGVFEDSRSKVISSDGGWGMLPGISVISALGLLAIALANTRARLELDGAVGLFWLGVLLIYVPIILRLISIEPQRLERVGLALLLGGSLYLVKLLHSPTAFTFGDEFSHWRTADDILQSGHLFAPNPLLPVSAFYPGLEVVISAVVNLGGLTIFQAGVLIVLVARIIQTLSLFLFFEKASRSAQVAGVASAIYVANPNYVFWTSQFSYESLALPLATLAILAVAMLANITDKAERFKFYGLSAIVMLSIIPTHHMTSYALISFLALWVLVMALKKTDLGLVQKVPMLIRRFLEKLKHRSRMARGILDRLWAPVRSSGGYTVVQHDSAPVGLLLLLFVAAVVWLVSVASLTVGYLSPVLGGAISEFVTLIAGESAPKQVFRSLPGLETPLWERLIAFGAIGQILFALPLGCFQLWRQHRSNIIGLVAGSAVLAYPITLAMRLTAKGTETSNRSSEFLFISISLVIALGVMEMWLFYRPAIVRSLVATVYLTTIFIGGVVVGFPPWARMPGPFHVGGDTRAIQLQGIESASWMRDVLGPGHRVISDGTNRKLLGSYGRQFMVGGVSWVYFSPIVGDLELSTLEKNEIQYLVVDRRLSTALSITGAYFESGEPQAGNHKEPMNLELLEKFDSVPWVDRLFDSGDIMIYDVSAASDHP